MIVASLPSWGNQVSEQMQSLAEITQIWMGQSSKSALRDPRFGSFCSAWLGWLLPIENEKQRSKIQSPQFAGSLWDASRGKLFLLSFYKCPPLSVCVCVCVCVCVSVLLSPSLTWDHIFPGSVVEPDPWWRSQAWQPSFISLPLGWRIYLWCQAWARFRIIQGFKSWGYEK